jgi:hypothetical protein
MKYSRARRYQYMVKSHTYIENDKTAEKDKNMDKH